MIIPNELSSRFNTVEGRKEIIQQFADSNTIFAGENSDGETVRMHVSDTGLILKTEQENGWIRVTFYDADGLCIGETFEGKSL